MSRMILYDEEAPEIRHRTVASAIITVTLTAIALGLYWAYWRAYTFSFQIQWGNVLPTIVTSNGHIQLVWQPVVVSTAVGQLILYRYGLPIWSSGTGWLLTIHYSAFGAIALSAITFFLVLRSRWIVMVNS